MTTFKELALEFQGEIDAKPNKNTRLAYTNSLKKLVERYGDIEMKYFYIEFSDLSTFDKRVLKHMLFVAKERGYISDVPKIKIPRERRRTRFLSEEEVQLLLKGKDTDLNMVIRVAIGTGLRKQNLIDLQWGQIDLKNLCIKVIVKGDKEIYIPIVRELADQLIAYNGQELFPPKRVFPEKNYDRKLRQLCRDLNIRDVSFHTLRHTYGSWLAMGGVDISTIAELMGHESIETTQRYIHIASEHKKAAIESLPKTFFTS